MTKLKRAISVDEITRTVFEEMPFEGEWKDLLGVPERSGVWFIWGNSGNGKTRFSMQLSKYLTQFGRVAYNALEEGARLSMQRAVIGTNMKEVAESFIILNRESFEAIQERLRKRKSPEIVFIDSVQYFNITLDQYKALKEEFTDKLFIFISHARGKEPKGSVAEFIRYDADVKIRVEGYKAFPISRLGGGKPYVIWQQGAALYWGELL